MSPPAGASAPARHANAPDRRPAARPGPARPIRRTAPTERRPPLSIVPPRAHRVHVLLAFGFLMVFVVLLATASLHTMLVSGQRDLDGVDNEIRTQTRASQALELRVAQLESPERVVDAARADGMIDPDEVTWLSPRPDGGAEESVTERPAPTAVQGGPGDEPPDMRAGGETDGDDGGPEGDGSGE